MTPAFVGTSREHVVEIAKFAPGMRLDRVIRKSPSCFSHDVLADLYEALVGCVLQLDRTGILHRDLSPDNILVSSSGGRLHLAIIDCSFCVLSDEPTRTRVSNANFTAPEQLKGQETLASELYSIGAILYYISTGMYPDPSNREAFCKGLSVVNLGLYSWSPSRYIVHLEDCVRGHDLCPRSGQFFSH